MSYIDTYKDGGIYDELDYGTLYVSRGVRFARWVCHTKRPPGKVLCVGCGNGYEVVEFLNNGIDAYGTEVHDIDVEILKDRIYKTTLPNKDFKDNEFSMVFCTEVVEHIPPEETDAFLLECKRIAPMCFFSIASRGDPPWNTHINIRSSNEWIETFERLGFNIKNFQYKPLIFNILGNMSLTSLGYEDGYVIIHEEPKDNIRW